MPRVVSSQAMLRIVIKRRRTNHPYGWLLHLHSCDWMSRHMILGRIRYTKPCAYRRVIAAMGPDAAINGLDIAAKLNKHNNVVIELRGKPSRQYKQTKFTEYFRLRR